MSNMNSTPLMLMIAVIIISISFAGCIDRESEVRIEITDQAGELLELDDTPRRIIALAPSLCEVLISLDSGNLLVGADSASAMENDDLDLEIVATYDGLDTEKMVALSPDLVIMDKNLDLSGDNYNMITSLSIPVYRAFPKDIDSVKEMIRDIGEVVGKKEDALKIVEDMNQREEIITVSLKDKTVSERRTVLYVMYYDGTSDPFVGTHSSFSGSLIEAAGGVNAIKNSAGSVVQISVEEVILTNPDVIITSQSTSWPTPTRSAILSDPAWEDINAVRNGEVRDIDGDIIDRTGPRLIDGIETLNSIIYG